MKITKSYFVLLVATMIINLNSSSGKNFILKLKESNSDSSLVIKLENEWPAAVINHNEKIFNKLIAKDFIYTENDWQYTRDEVFQSFMSTTETIGSAFNEDMQVLVKDNVAIVTGWLTIRGKGSKETFKRKYRFTDFWFYKNGVWQLIAAQDYLLP